MRNAYLIVGVAALIVALGAWYAINHNFSAARHTQDTVSSSTNPMSSTLSLSSTAFEQNGSIPSAYTCDAKENNSQMNPPLAISGVPEGAKSLALIMDDPDIPQAVKDEMRIQVFDHWVLFNIPPETKEMASGMTAGMPGNNSAGKAAYAGPCPPPQYEPSTHRYFFKLYALDTMLDLKAGASRADAERAMQGHILEETQLIGTYKRK